MRNFYSISLILTLVIAGTYWYRSTANVCPAPLSYRVGVIDQSFDITPEEAKQSLAQAEYAWESATGRELFVYDDSSNFTIDFKYDDRQAKADSELAEKKSLDQKKKENEDIRAAVIKLQSEHKEASAEYEARIKKYEARLDEYNIEVNKYNDRGGAPEGVFDELEKERKYLNNESESLNKTAGELNELIKSINELNDKGNQLVDIYNRGVNEYNAKYGFEDEFTQGDYQGDKIHIYKFSNESELQRVLAHEFGHALGIDHVEGTSSLMYYLLDDTGSSVTLSTEDQESFNDVCGKVESNEQKIRRFIRDLLKL